MNKKTGFTLIELMVVITIIAILSAVAILGLTSLQQRAQDTKHLAGIQNIQIALEAYKSINNTYPDNLGVMVPTYLKTSETADYAFIISTDKKTYCTGVKGGIFKPSSQPDWVFGEKTWRVCKGPDATFGASF